jgi:uncharacterized membrane protein YkoI
MKRLTEESHHSGMNTAGFFRCSMLMIWLAAALAASADSDDAAQRAREGVRIGDLVPLEQIIEDALARYPGQIIDVELDDDEYELEVLTRSGVKLELEYDARSGELLEVEVDG